MLDGLNRSLDLSDPARVWSLRTAEIPFTNGSGDPDHHCFLLLIDETTGQSAFGGVILDELHIKPVGGNNGPDRESTAAPVRPTVLMLGAEVYTNPGRRLDGLFTTTYDKGRPDRMLHVWNMALRAGGQIAKLGRCFEVDDCRAGARAVIESLGYRFETMPGLRPGLDRGLSEAISAHLPDAARREASELFDEFRRLHDLLASQRTAIAFSHNEMK